MRGFVKLAILGAAAMYFYDPENGVDRRRRLAEEWDGLCDSLESAGQSLMGEGSGRGMPLVMGGSEAGNGGSGLVVIDDHGIEHPSDRP